MYSYKSGLEFEDDNQKSSEHKSDLTQIYSPALTVENQDSHHSHATHSVASLESDSNPSEEKIKNFISLAFQETSSVSCPRPLLRSVHQASESSDTGTDYDYSPDEDWRKTIQVGSDFQAVVPEGLSEYDDAPAYENEDKLLWNPSVLSEKDVIDYLMQCRKTTGTNNSSVSTVPTGSHIRDDEHALFLLLQCGHNKEEALRRHRMQPCPDPYTMSLWSEEECRSFEAGIKLYGKDFHLIQLNKVRTRAGSELVQFYYLWKKTERHDVFANKNRIEKKKYSLHPGTTDFMDRFLDEQENPSNIRDRSSSPSSRLLIHDENKKMTPLTSPETNDDNSVPELSMQNFDGLCNTNIFSTVAVDNFVDSENSSNKNLFTDASNTNFITGDDKGSCSVQVSHVKTV